MTRTSKLKIIPVGQSLAVTSKKRSEIALEKATKPKPKAVKAWAITTPPKYEILPAELYSSELQATRFCAPGEIVEPVTITPRQPKPKPRKK